MRSTRRVSWTRTVSWASMEAPPEVACLETHAILGGFSLRSKSRRGSLFMTDPHLNRVKPLTLNNLSVN
jgi:hypothetical protein